RVVAAVLEALEPLDQDRHDVAVGYGSDDSTHRVFFRMKSRPHTAVAAAASATKSRSSALRLGRKIWCTSSKAPKATTEASTAIGARPQVPRHKSAVITEYNAKCATLSQPCGIGCDVTKSSTAMMPPPAARQMKRSIGILLAQHHDDGLQHDLQVEEQRPAAQVREVVLDARLHLLDRVGLAAEAVHLGEAGDSRPHLVADHVAADQLAVELVVRHRMRPRPDDAHAALQHVDELRQLVERGLAQECAELRDAAVVLGRLPHDIAVLGDRHGAELVDHDLAAVDPVAPLLEEDRAGRGELD